MVNFMFSSLRAPLIWLTLLATTAFAMNSCGRGDKPPPAPPPAETADPLFLRGRELRARDPDGALENFLQVIYARRGDAPESHLEAGMIFLRDKKSPLEAVYHLKQFLRLRPGTARTARVEEWLAAADALYARKMPAPRGADTSSHFLNENNLFESNRLLRDQNRQLKTENAALQKRVGELERAARRAARANPAAPPPSVANPTSVKKTAPPPPGVASQRRLPASYTVVKGDTLSRISSKIYGSSVRWPDIYNANRDKLPSEDSVRPGMVLRIPSE